MNSIFEAANKTVGKNGGTSKPNVNPLPIPVANQKPRIALTKEQLNLAIHIKNARHPRR